MWRHQFNWGESGVIDADLEVIAAEDPWPKQGDLAGNVAWVRDINSAYWFGPGAFEQMITMLAADLLLPGLGLVFSGGAARPVHRKVRG